jgi:hypothetical protein
MLPAGEKIVLVFEGIGAHTEKAAPPEAVAHRRQPRPKFPGSPFFADLGQPVCRFKDEPRPTRAIVHACSRVASRNGTAGYKLMRSSHATWTSTLNPPTTSIPRPNGKTTTRHRPFLSRQHSAVLDQSRTSPLGGAIAPSLTDLARRAPQTPGSGRKNRLFRSNKRMDESEKEPRSRA